MLFSKNNIIVIPDNVSNNSCLFSFSCKTLLKGFSLKKPRVEERRNKIRKCLRKFNSSLVLYASSVKSCFHFHWLKFFSLVVFGFNLREVILVFYTRTILILPYFIIVGRASSFQSWSLGTLCSISSHTCCPWENKYL